MFLSGDKTFMSFSVGAMLVVAVAMLGSLTVLPAVLSQARRPGREGPDPVRAPPPPQAGRRAASGAPSSTASCGSPLVSAVAAAAVLVALAVPTLSLHTTQTGIDGITSPAVEPFERIIDAFPGTPEPAVVAIKADDVNAAPVRAAIADLKRKALATGEMNAPINVDTNRDGTVARVEIPLAGNGTDDASTGALATLRERRAAGDGRTGSTASSTPSPARPRTRRTSTRPRRARSRRSSASSSCSRSGSCSSRSARS